MTAIHIGLCVLLSVCALSVSERDLRDVQAYQAVKGVIDDYNRLVDLFESIEQFLNRLEIYTKVPHTVAMTEIIVKILVELLSILALTTKQIKQGRMFLSRRQIICRWCQGCSRYVLLATIEQLFI